MYDSRVQWSGDMCMTLSGHTSTLPRRVVQGHGFEASFLRWARLDFSPQVRRFLTEAMIFIAVFVCARKRGKTKTAYRDIADGERESFDTGNAELEGLSLPGGTSRDQTKTFRMS